MLEQLNKAKDKWGGHHSLIDRWLDDRQQLLLKFCHMSKLDDATNPHTLPDSEPLNSFCQQLLDYISLGHFEVYESLVTSSKNQGDASLKLAKNLYPEITLTTETALAFNDKYANFQAIDDYKQLSKDLSLIGETIAFRIELEDQLIETFHKNH